MKKLALLLALAVPLFGQEGPRDEVYPPDSEAGVEAVTPEPPPPAATCPCKYVGTTVNDYIAAKCTGMGYAPQNTCIPGPANPAFVFTQCDPGGANPPWTLVLATSNDGAATCDFHFQNCDAGFPCTPVTDWDSGSVGGLTATEQDLCDAEFVPPLGPCT